MNSPTRAALTGAVKRKKVVLYTLGIVLAVFAVLAPTLFYQPPTAELQLGGQKLSLQIAGTDAAREQGLSGRSTLAENKGMLFVFTAAAKQCFWMKNMQFPIDMIFVGHDKRVIRIQPDVSPKTYPKNFCADNTQYVIELNAGAAQRFGLHSGQTLKFS